MYITFYLLMLSHTMEQELVREDQRNSLLARTFSIIIPAYNEEKRIGQTIRDLEANVPDILEILVIFDGTDRTPEIAQQSGKKVKVVRFYQRVGHGGAVFEGIRRARGDVICFIDADGLYVHVQGKYPLAALYCSGDHGDPPDSLILGMMVKSPCAMDVLP